MSPTSTSNSPSSQHRKQTETSLLRSSLVASHPRDLEELDLISPTNLLRSRMKSKFSTSMSKNEMMAMFVNCSIDFIQPAEESAQSLHIFSVEPNASKGEKQPPQIQYPNTPEPELEPELMLGEDKLTSRSAMFFDFKEQSSDSTIVDSFLATSALNDNPSAAALALALAATRTSPKKLPALTLPSTIASTEGIMSSPRLPPIGYHLQHLLLRDQQQQQRSDGVHSNPNSPPRVTTPPSLRLRSQTFHEPAAANDDSEHVREDDHHGHQHQVSSARRKLVAALEQSHDSAI